MVAEPQHNNGRPPPRPVPLRNNIDAEQSILGGILLRNELLDALPELEVGDFYDHRNKVVFAAMRTLRAAEQPIDVVTVELEIERCDQLQGTTKLDAIGGPAYLGELLLRVPTADNVLTYAASVRLLQRQRLAELAISATLQRARVYDGDPVEMIGELIGELQRCETDLGGSRASRMRSSRLLTIPDALEELVDLARAPIYPTPFPTLNDAIGMGGLLGTQVYTVAAGTGRGKSSFVAEIAAFTAASGIPVIVASYEMLPGYFVARKAAGLLGVHSNQILRHQGVAMADVLAAMPYANFFLMRRPTLRELGDQVRRVSEKFGMPPLVIVDYLQKLADVISLTMQRPDLRLATTEASAKLIALAENTSCAVIAISAIGRGKGKQLSTPRKFEPYELVEVAKESGAVEYDGAGLVVLSLSKEFDGDERIATMTLAKARFGTEIHIDARYHGARGTWRDVGRAATPVDMPDAKPAAPEPSVDELRLRLISELHKAPARHKTELVRRTIGNKTSLGIAYDALLRDGVICKVGTGITLSPMGRQLVIEVAP